MTHEERMQAIERIAQQRLREEEDRAIARMNEEEALARGVERDYADRVKQILETANQCQANGLEFAKRGRDGAMECRRKYTSHYRIPGDDRTYEARIVSDGIHHSFGLIKDVIDYDTIRYVGVGWINGGACGWGEVALMNDGTFSRHDETLDRCRRPRKENPSARDTNDWLVCFEAFETGFYKIVDEFYGINEEV